MKKSGPNGMRIISNKLLILMAASVNKKSTFTNVSLAEETVATFPNWFTGSEAEIASLRSTVYSMAASGLTMQVGEQESASDNPHHRHAYLYCFTDAGRAQRLDASKKIKSILSELQTIIDADLHNVTRMTTRKRVA